MILSVIVCPYPCSLGQCIVGIREDYFYSFACQGVVFDIREIDVSHRETRSAHNSIDGVVIRNICTFYGIFQPLAYLGRAFSFIVRNKIPTTIFTFYLDNDLYTSKWYSVFRLEGDDNLFIVALNHVVYFLEEVSLIHLRGVPFRVCFMFYGKAIQLSLIHTECPCWDILRVQFFESLDTVGTYKYSTILRTLGEHFHKVFFRSFVAALLSLLIGTLAIFAAHIDVSLDIPLLSNTPVIHVAIFAYVVSLSVTCGSIGICYSGLNLLFHRSKACLAHRLRLYTSLFIFYAQFFLCYALLFVGYALCLVCVCRERKCYLWCCLAVKVKHHLLLLSVFADDNSSLVQYLVFCVVWKVCYGEVVGYLILKITHAQVVVVHLHHQLGGFTCHWCTVGVRLTIVLHIECSLR